jgi:eukaryotic-like serine/threonine-protein kinase
VNSPERSQKIEDLFHAALERPLDERTTFLAKACSTDPALYNEVAALITAHEQKNPSIESPPVAAGAPVTQGISAATSRALRAPGETIGPYKILRLLGRGGMGEVYLAEDSRLARKVALKILPSEVSEHLDRLRRFEREARAISALNHPNIITIFEVGEANGLRFLAMEYVKGPTLRQMFSRSRLPLGQVVEIATQITTALAAAHEAGIVHRDIKPENIMVRPDGLVKVLDFGLAKLGEQWPGTAPSSISIPGIILGTPSYMSPEQACGRSIGPSSDIFSLGVVMYELIAGSAPFRGPSSSEIIAKILTTQPQALAEIAPETPPELEAIIARSLNKDETLRYQTAGEMLSDIKSVSRHLASDEVELRNELRVRSGRSIPTHAPAAETLYKSVSERLDSGVRSVARSVWEHRFLSGVLSLGLIALTAVGVPRLIGRGEAINSVAVLPFLNTNGDPNLEYISDGLAQDLINSLSRFPALKVTPWNSVSRLKGREIKHEEVGKKLGVKAVVTGHLIKEGEKLILALELVDTSDNHLLWGARYDRTPIDLPSVVPQMNRELSDHLRTGAKSTDQARSVTTNPQAYDLFLKGQFLRDKRTEEDLRKSLDCFRLATEKDPSFAAAFAGLSSVYTILGADLLHPSETGPQAKQHAARALELDPSLPDAHYAMAAVNFYYEWDWPATEREVQAALEQNPRHVLALCLYANLMLMFDHPNEAIEKAQLAVKSGPLSLLAHARLGAVYYYAHSFDLGDQEYRQALELEPRFSTAHLAFAWSLERRGQYEKALDELDQCLKLSPDNAEGLAAKGRVYAALQRRSDALAMLERLNSAARERYVSPTYFAHVYAALSDSDQAIAQLEKAFTERCPYLTELSDRQTFPSLRSDPRFNSLLDRLRIPR